VIGLLLSGWKSKRLLAIRGCWLAGNPSEFLAAGVDFQKFP
jgi:hypothetical protein